jgi:hypothetical protein
MVTDNWTVEVERPKKNRLLLPPVETQGKPRARA